MRSIWFRRADLSVVGYIDVRRAVNSECMAAVTIETSDSLNLARLLGYRSANVAR